MTTGAVLKSDFERHGFAIIPLLVEPDVVASLCAEVDRLLASSSQRGGVRNVLAKSSQLRRFAEGGSPAQAARELLGATARPTKLTIFDKTPQANWKVPWHQDLTISVRERRDVDGFGPWSIKDGIHHVQPPACVLEQIVAVRLHLDDTPPENGALRVVPGSHRHARLTEDQTTALRRRALEYVCEVSSGGAMLMSPLLLHASSAASSPTQRRILHFEYSAAQLPEQLEWA